MDARLEENNKDIAEFLRKEGSHGNDTFIASVKTAVNKRVSSNAEPRLSLVCMGRKLVEKHFVLI